MKTRYFATACIAALSSSVNAQYPSLTAMENDQEITLYVQYPNWASATTSGSSFSYNYNNRMYLSTSPTLDPQSFYKPNLLGGSMEYDVDLSQVSCGCVSALYTVLMPAADNNVQDPFKYCDANQVGGHWCPEFDIQEANRHAFHATAHECDAPSSNGVYHNCDRGGECTADIYYEAANTYGFGSQYTINTERPFHVKVDFQETDEVFTGYRMTFTQEGREVVMDPQTGNCSAYLPAMTSDITQMVFAMSHWTGGDLSWMQHDLCSGGCQQNAT